MPRESEAALVYALTHWLNSLWWSRWVYLILPVPLLRPVNPEHSVSTSRLPDPDTAGIGHGSVS